MFFLDLVVFCQLPIGGTGLGEESAEPGFVEVGGS